MDKFNVLLVEDDEIDVMIVKKTFVKANITNPLFVAKDGIEALEQLRSDKFSKPIIILLDLNLPKMNGIEFLEIIKQDDALKFIPVIILTSSSDDEDIYRAYENSVSGYLTKPVNIGQFVEKMAAVGHYWSLCEVINGKQ